MDIRAMMKQAQKMADNLDKLQQQLSKMQQQGPQMKQLQDMANKLGQCAACREEYETLRDLRWLEKGGQLPSVDDLRDLLP